MNKPYTIIAFFSVGEYTERDECWIAHFETNTDAFKAFKLKVKETHTKMSNDDLTSVFNNIMTNGCSFICDDGTMLFVRHEEVYTKFIKKVVAWD